MAEQPKKTGQIQIFAKNIKGVSHGSILEESKFTRNVAGGNHIQNGGNGVNNNVNVERREILTEIIVLEITSEITGYTIQGVKGMNYYLSDPAVVVPTYKVKIITKILNSKKELKNSKVVGEFDVTRDSWYSLGKKNGKIELLNRAFVPLNYSQNLYTVFWIPSYPNQLRYLKSGLDAFIFTRFGNRQIPAQPLHTQKNIDGSNIEHSRINEKIASDVMIHVGGTYSFKGINHLGGSFGCFGFIEKDDIYATPELAEQASVNDKYDNSTTNDKWKEMADNIIKLSFGKNKVLQILLDDRNESQNYFPPKILQE